MNFGLVVRLNLEPSHRLLELRLLCRCLDLAWAEEGQGAALRYSRRRRPGCARRFASRAALARRHFTVQVSVLLVARIVGPDGRVEYAAHRLHLVVVHFLVFDHAHACVGPPRVVLLGSDVDLRRCSGFADLGRLQPRLFRRTMPVLHPNRAQRLLVCHHVRVAGTARVPHDAIGLSGRPLPLSVRRPSLVGAAARRDALLGSPLEGARFVQTFTEPRKRDELVLPALLQKALDAHDIRRIIVRTSLVDGLDQWTHSLLRRLRGAASGV